MEKNSERSRRLIRFGKRKEQNVQDEQKRMREKNSRKALIGVQLKYTFLPVLWLVGSMIVILTGLFLFNLLTKVVDRPYEVSFLEQLQALPLAVTFLALITGVQVILTIGFSKMEKNVLAMNQIPLSRELKDLMQWEYSFLVTAGTFFAYFLMLCLWLFLENLLSPETAYGFSELYPVFYRFTHLYRVYPIGSVWGIPVLLGCVAAVSVIAPIFTGRLSETVRTEAVWGILIISSILFYFFDKSEQPVWDFTLMVFVGSIHIVRITLAYRRRQKNERAEVVERVE